MPSDFTRAGEIATALIPSDSTPGIAASPATQARNHLFDELWEDLLAIAETARSISRQEPRFSTAFRLGEPTQREIIAAATAFFEQRRDPAMAARFIAYSLPADFVTDLQSDLAAIRGKGDEQTDDRLEDVADTAANRSLIKQAREVIRNLNTSVKKRFRRDPAILAEWTTASRIHRTGSSGSGDATSPPAPPLG
jgi:hypothetical protein